MYPTKIKDMDGLLACLDRMYKDYTAFCKLAGGSSFVMPKEEWLDTVRKLPPELLTEIVYSFNQKELSVINN